MTATSTLFDASAYRALARDGDRLLDHAGARDRGRALADVARDATPNVSPFVLWALLADVAAGVPSERAGRTRRAPSEAEHDRAARARIGLAICAAHASTAKTGAGAHGFALAIDPDSAACLAIGLQPPAAIAVWNEYLASLASEIADEPTAERAQRLATPLGHVAERARSAIADFSDEMQDAVLTAYDTASAAWAWDDETSDEDRQRALTGPLPPRATSPSPGEIGEPLMLEILRRDPLLRAVAAGRVSRAHAVIARAAMGAPDDELMEPTPASLPEVAHIAGRFPTGLALGREMLRRVIAGDLEVAERAARRWLWDLNASHGIVDGRGVTGNAVLAESLVSAIPGIETLPAYRARVRV